MQISISGVNVGNPRTSSLGGGEAVKVFFSLLFNLYKTEKKAGFIFEETETYEKGFSDYYKDNLLEDAKEYNDARVKALKRSQLFLYSIFLPIIAIEIYAITYFGGNPLFYVMAAGAALFITMYPIKKYKNNLKGNIFPIITNFINDFSYEPKCPVRAREYKDFQILPSYDEEKNEDYFKGLYKGVNIELFESTLLKEYRNKNGKQTSIVFRGLLISLDVHKPFSKKTIITTDRGGIGNWFSKQNYKNYHKEKNLENVALEDPIFEKAFEVFSQDQIEARYLLTTSFMDRLLKLQNFFGKKSRLKASFNREKLLITIPSSKNLFEPGSILEPEDFVDDAKKFLKEISIIFEIIDTLKLDQDIGM